LFLSFERPAAADVKKRMDSLRRNEPTVLRSRRAFCHQRFSYGCFRGIITGDKNRGTRRFLKPRGQGGADLEKVLSGSCGSGFRNLESALECFFLCQNFAMCLADHDLSTNKFGGPRFFVGAGGLEKKWHPMDGVSRTKLLRMDLGIGLCKHNEMLHRGLPGKIIHHLRITQSFLLKGREWWDRVFTTRCLIVRKIPRSREKELGDRWRKNFRVVEFDGRGPLGFES